jgi:hypothetical protein
MTPVLETRSAAVPLGDTGILLANPGAELCGGIPDREGATLFTGVCDEF